MSRRSANDFHVLERRIRMQGVLTTRTALHIGSGTPTWETASDLPVLRDALDRPFIPGSTLKGVIRSTIEAILRASERRDRGLWACDPLAKKDACGYHEQGKREEAVAAISNHCAVCRLLGSHVLASHVRFSDALPLGDIKPRIEVRDGVAIDRDLRTVYQNQKYDFETVAPGTDFNLEVFIDNPDDWTMGLLIMGFDQLADGFAGLGGFTSRGLGRVDLAWTEFLMVTAEDLLENRLAEPITDEKKLAAELKRWRDKLADIARAD